MYIYIYRRNNQQFLFNREKNTVAMIRAVIFAIWDKIVKKIDLFLSVLDFTI